MQEPQSLPPQNANIGDQSSTGAKGPSLQLYLGLALSGLIIVFSLLLATLLDRLAKDEIMRLAQENLENISLQMARELSSGMNDFSKEIQVQVNWDRFRNPKSTPAEMRDALDQVVKTRPEFAFLGVIDIPTGRVLAANAGLFEGGDSNGRPVFEEGKKGLFLGDVHPAVRLAELLPRPANGDTLRFLDAAAPILDSNGQPFRVLAGHIDFQWTDQVRQLVLAPLEQKHGVEILLVDTAGKVVLSPNSNVKTGTPLASLLPETRTSGTTVARWADRVEYLTTTSPVVPKGSFPGFGWSVVARQPADIVLQASTTLRNSFFAGALLLGLAAAVIAWLIARRFIQPMAVLADSAERLLTHPSIMPLPKNPFGEVARMQDALSRLASEGRRHAQASAEQQRQFVALADSLPDLVFQADAHGAINYVNRQWLEELGAPEGLGLNDLSALIEPADLADYASLWEQSHTSGNDLEYTARIGLAGGGARQWFRLRGRAVRDQDGAILRWVGAMTNVHQEVIETEQVEAALKTERKTRAEIERVSRMKDEFLATLSHELRTPLNVISGWAQMLEQRAEADAYTMRAASIINRNVDLQAALISDLLDMSAIIAGKVGLDAKPVDGAELLGTLTISIQQLAEAKGVILKTDLPAAPVMLLAEQRRLNQAFGNLLSNAIKFTEAGGTVGVHAVVADQRYVVRITDSGCGIAAEFLPYVFERFRQEDASSTRRRGGIGLGLAIARSLVELHDGTIRAASDGPGRGCTFTVSLPLLVAQPDTLRPRGAAGLSTAIGENSVRDISLLLIDDDHDAREMAREMLLMCGARVTAAQSAAEALSVLDRARFDLIVCDIGMPDMDGHAFMRAVRASADPATAATPAIALSAFAMKQDKDAASRAGFQAHVAKPFSAPVLIDVIARMASRSDC